MVLIPVKNVLYNYMFCSYNILTVMSKRMVIVVFNSNWFSGCRLYFIRMLFYRLYFKSVLLLVKKMPHTNILTKINKQKNK